MKIITKNKSNINTNSKCDTNTNINSKCKGNTNSNTISITNSNRDSESNYKDQSLTRESYNIILMHSYTHI